MRPRGSSLHHVGRLLLIGTGFLAITMAWQVYTAYMPLYYGHLVQYSTLAGLIMGLDNLLGKLVQPWIGAMSDGTHTRWGRRVPFLLAGAPVAALLLLAIPAAASWGLLPLILVASLMNLAMATFQAPVVALMPDVTPSHLRSTGNGVINLMGGIGGVIAFGLGLVFKVNVGPSFYVVAAVLLVVTLLYAAFVRERQWALAQPPGEQAAAARQERISFVAALREAARVTVELLRSGNRSVLGLFWAIFAWSMGYTALDLWFTTYATRVLHATAGAAAASMAFAAGAIVLAAVPAGYLGRWLGRRWTIRIGLVGLVAMLTLMSLTHSLGPIRLMLALVGIFWALVIINAYPMVVDLVSARYTGVYTGLYYIFSGVPTIVSPFLFGALQDWLGYGVVFPGTVACMLIALGCFWLVKQGEASGVQTGS